MDYTELVKRLRYKAGWDESGDLEQAADAIEKLDRLRSAAEENRLHWERMAVEFEIAMHTAEEKLPKWIPVNERLPKKDGTFITAYRKGGVSQNWYMTFHHGGGKWYQNSEDTGEVTHWMPLPQPPKEEQT